MGDGAGMNNHAYTIRPTLVVCFDGVHCEVSVGIESSELFTKTLLSQGYHLGYVYQASSSKFISLLNEDLEIDEKEFRSEAFDWLSSLSNLSDESLEKLLPEHLFPNILVSVVAGADSFEPGLRFAESIAQTLSEVALDVQDPVLIVSIPDAQEEESLTRMASHRKQLDAMTSSKSKYSGRIYIVESRTENGWIVKNHVERVSTIIELLASSPFSNHKECNLPADMFTHEYLTGSREYYVVNARISKRKHPWELFFTLPELKSTLAQSTTVDRGGLFEAQSSLKSKVRQCVAQSPRSEGELDRELQRFDVATEGYFKQAYKCASIAEVHSNLNDLYSGKLDPQVLYEHSLLHIPDEEVDKEVVESRGIVGKLSSFFAMVRIWLLGALLLCVVILYFLYQLDQLGWLNGLIISLAMVLCLLAILTGRNDLRRTYKVKNLNYRLRALIAKRITTTLHVSGALVERNLPATVTTPNQSRIDLLEACKQQCQNILGRRAYWYVHRAAKNLKDELDLDEDGNYVNFKCIASRIQKESTLKIDSFLKEPEVRENILSVIRTELYSWLSKRQEELIELVSGSCKGRHDMPFKNAQFLDSHSTTGEWLLLGRELYDPELDVDQLASRSQSKVYFGCPKNTSAAHFKIKCLTRNLEEE